jgi:metal-responsive CopG/Arc/MetJ family transcriptional regulator
MKRKSPAAKKRGRPTTIDATTFLGLRLPLSLVEAIDSWAAHTEVSRSEAARRLVELGLKAKGKAAQAGNRTPRL